MMSQYPLGFGQWLQALSYVLSKPRVIAIIGNSDSADTQALLRVAREGYQPFRVTALAGPDAQPLAVPLLQDRGLVNGHSAAYVCRAPVPGCVLSEGTGIACQAPVVAPEGLRAQLECR